VFVYRAVLPMGLNLELGNYKKKQLQINATAQTHQINQFLIIQLKEFRMVL